MAKWLMLAGLLLLAIGAVLHYAPWLVSWFGRLPGDIRYESGNSKVFVPITSMLLVSIVLSVLVHFLRR